MQALATCQPMSSFRRPTSLGWSSAEARMTSLTRLRRHPHFGACGKYFISGGNCPFLVGIKDPSPPTRKYSLPMVT